jgi:hypothetical protein
VRVVHPAAVFLVCHGEILSGLVDRVKGYVKSISNSKFDSVGHLALNLARALARNNTSSKSMIKSKSKTKASRKDNTLLNLAR